MNYIILLPSLLSVILGIMMFKKDSQAVVMKKGFIFTCIVSLATFIMLALLYDEHIILLRHTDVMSFSFRIDGAALIFVALISFLWPLASLYATKYMTHEGGESKFFAFYIMTFGVVIAFACAANLLTMYLCFELLTFVTLPLVVHGGKEKDLFAAKRYIYYSVGGAALSFMGMMLFLNFAGTWEFNSGVFANMPPNTYLYLAYIFMFMGFGVKAGIFPFHNWLISAGVAPTPVTALLHAVAVVKSGAFATLRVTYYLFDEEYLYGTIAQSFVMVMCIITIIYGSSMALKNKHLKRRFAYSTVSQLSYIMLAVTAMSTAGLIAALFHIVFHALVKIVIFYTAGNVMYVNHAEYVRDIEGYGKKMQLTFIAFTLSSLALIGIPPFGGFSSKFQIASAVIAVEDNIGFAGVLALMVSALLTAMYLLQLVVLAFVPHNDLGEEHLAKVQEAPKEMTFAVTAITSVMVVASLFSSQIYTFMLKILGGQ